MTPDLMPPASPLASAWARVTIRLNGGQLNEAVTEAALASQLLDWDLMFGDYYQYGGPRVYGSDDIPVGWAWVEPASGRLVLSAAVVDEFCWTSVLATYADQAQLFDQAGFQRYDVAEWRLR
jgi:hypothetical protein